MTSHKTKDQLVDVARQLFARHGVENTTMNDIAIASQKGRRTLYTYFKSKEDIYMAVVESELDKLFDQMRTVVERDISPDEKFVELIFTHLRAVKETVYRNGTLRGRFFRDIWKVEKVRKTFDQREIVLFREVLEEEQHIQNRQTRAPCCHPALLRQRTRSAVHTRADRRGNGRKDDT